MSDYESKLRMYSMGIVLEAKVRTSPFIKVYPIEELPLANGKIVDQKRINKGTSKDIKGIAKDANLTGDNIIVARWLASGEGNRATPPDVQPGEKVVIYKFADADEYFWDCREFDRRKRKLETVRHEYCNIPKGIDPHDDDTCYWTEVSTHDKHIRIHTSKNDGEPTTYDITIDTGGGVISIVDDLGNFIRHESVTGLLHAKFNTEIRLEAPLVRFIANHVVNETPLVTNTGTEETEGTSLANQHVNCVD